MIVTTLIVIQLVLLTVAVAVLFAMMGELTNRTSQAFPGAVGAAPVQLLDDAPIGKVIQGLPPSFESGRGGIVLVFSTTCHACEELAPEAARFFNASPGSLIGVLVSCGTEGSGSVFVSGHDLEALPVHLDVGGAVATRVLGVSVSPAAVAVSESGVVMSAVAFSSYASLTPWLESTFGKALDPVDERTERP